MNIPLNSFEQYIDETILQRGLQYFKKGLVYEPEEIAPGEFEAIVEGTEQYTVQLTIKNKVVTEHVCSCPYDFGPVCKHVVAVLFHLLQNDLDLSVTTKKDKKTGAEKKTPKKKTITEQVDEILDKVSHNDLKMYIKEQCANDRSFRQLFFANFAHLVITDSKELYAKQIQSILKAAGGRHGYIEYSETRAVSSVVYAMVERAEQFVESSNYQTSMYIACAVLEEMSKALEYVDDSNGDISGCVESSVEVLDTLSGEPLPEGLRKELFNYCLKSFQKGIYKDWDWHFSMLNIATEIILNQEEAAHIHALLDEIKPNSTSWDWDFDNAQQIRFALIEKIEGKGKATHFMEQNIANSDFRKKVIVTAISNSDYSKAIALCEEGIKLDDKEKPGLADDWRDYLLKIYILQNNLEKIGEYARYLFLNSIREKKYYFDLLKKITPTEMWVGFVDQLVIDFKKGKRWLDIHFIAQIYIWEERWPHLLEIVKLNVSLNTLESYEKYLIKEFATEIADLYQQAIFKYLENNIGRNHYKNACRYLRRMIKMGAREKANFVIEQLRLIYPKRKALMEELLKV